MCSQGSSSKASPHITTVWVLYKKWCHSARGWQRAGLHNNGVEGAVRSPNGRSLRCALGQVHTEADQLGIRPGRCCHLVTEPAWTSAIKRLDSRGNRCLAREGLLELVVPVAQRCAVRLRNETQVKGELRVLAKLPETCVGWEGRLDAEAPTWPTRRAQGPWESRRGREPEPHSFCGLAGSSARPKSTSSLGRE